MYFVSIFLSTVLFFLSLPFSFLSFSFSFPMHMIVHVHVHVHVYLTCTQCTWGSVQEYSSDVLHSCGGIVLCMMADWQNGSMGTDPAAPPHPEETLGRQKLSEICQRIPDTEEKQYSGMAV